jgi:hypothetical protein
VFSSGSAAAKLAFEVMASSIAWAPPRDIPRSVAQATGYPLTGAACRVRKSILSGTQIHSSCCSGVFVDESAESVVSVELVWWVGADEA